MGLWLTCATFLSGNRISATQFETLWSYNKLEAGYRNELGDVAIDREGNIWVLGRFEDANDGARLLLSKINSQGNEIWTTNFADGSYLWQPRLALAPSGGCVFGASSTNGTVLLRFDSGGQHLWQALLSNPDGNYTYLSAIAWDADGNIWVTGTFGTCKVNPAGGRIWSKPNRPAQALQPLPGQGMVALVDQGVMTLTTDGEVIWRAEDFVSRNAYPKSYTYAARLIVAQDQSILVGGIIEDAITVAKYGGDGMKVWQTEYQGKAMSHETIPDDALSEMRVHSSGAVYLVGRSKGSSYRATDFLTMKLGRDGTTLWRARERFGGLDGATGLALDSSEHTYSLGSYSAYTNGQYVTHALLTKYDGNGSRVGTSIEIPMPADSLLLTEDGNLLVYGRAYYNGVTSGLGLTMLRELSAPETLHITEPIPDQTVAENGNVTLSTAVTGPEPFDYQWMFNDVPIGGATGPQLTISGIRVDQDGDYSVQVRSGASVITSSDATVIVSTVPTIYASPRSQSALLGGQADFSVGALSTTPLCFRWWKDGQAVPGATSNQLTLTNLQVTQGGLYHATVSSFAGSTDSRAARLRVFASSQQIWNSSFDDLGYPSGASVDSGGNFVVGSMNGSLGTVLKIDPTGEELWRVSGLHVLGLARDSDDNLYFAGSDPGSSQVQFGKISPAGHVEWLTNFAAPGPNFYISAFALDRSINLVAVGIETTAIHIFKYDSRGNRVWAASQAEPQGGSWVATSVAVGPEGQVYVVGVSGEGIGASAWLFALNLDGRFNWSARLGNVDDWYSQTAKVVVDGAGNIAVFFRGTERNSLALASYDPAGNRRWILEPSFDAGTVFVPVDVVLSGDNALTIGGNLLRFPSTGVRDEWIVKRIDQEGRILWSASYLGESDQRMATLTVDRRGRVYVSGGYGTFHYTENGVLIWHVDTLSAALGVTDDAGNFYTANVEWYGRMTLAKYQPTAEGEAFRFLAPLPASQLIRAGEALNVEAKIESAVPLHFQWTIDGEPLAGQTNATIRILQVGLEHAGRLGLEVYGSLGLLAFPYVDVTVSTKPVILEEPQDTAQVLGGDVQFAVSAQGTSPLRYQWLFGGSELLGKTNSILIVSNVSPACAGTYAVRVAAWGSETLSQSAQLAVGSTMTQAWVAAFSNSSGAYRSGQHVTLDDIGNVYVLGATGPSFPNDFTALRYSPAGTLIWSHTEPMEAYASEGIAGYAWARSGELILVGSRGSSDVAVVSATTSGTMSLVAVDFGPPGSYDVARAVAVDAGNNVYVTGETSDFGGASYYGTMKLDSQRHLVWAQRFTTNSVRQSGSRAVAVDNSGKAFVAGTSGTLRYEPDGRLTWSALGFDDRAVAIDEHQNLLVTGSSVETNVPPTWWLRKYGPAGDLIWASGHPLSPGAEPPCVLLFDGAGSTFVAGKPGAFKFDAAGRELWSVTNFNVAAAARYRSGVVVVGSFVGERPVRYVTLAFDRDGNRQWAAQLYDFTAPYYEQSTARGIAAEIDGRVYVTGRFGGNIVTVCYSPVETDAVHLSSPVLGSDATLQFVLRAPVGRSFRIQGSDNLAEWKDWIGGRTVELDTYIKTPSLSAENSPHFFRAQIEP